MRILKESEITYSIEDILDAINEELGFSAIRITDKTYRIKLTGLYQLSLDFDEEVSIKLKLDNKEVDLSEGTAEAESLVTACESSIEIVDIVERMTGGASTDDYS